MSKILVTRSSMPPIEEYFNEIRELWETHLLTNMGTKHKQLQNELKSYLDVSNIDLLVNGHMALELSLQALNLKGEVITTPFTFASTTHAIVRNGLTPVFCDINPNDFTLDVNKLEALITDKTCAILPVHVYGNICDVNGINEIARKYNLKVIYDAAHAFGESYENRGIGSYGDVSCFSFHATKVFNTIEGGAACFKDEAFGLNLYRLKNFGIRGPEIVDWIGANAKMNEFCAAMGLCNLRHVNVEIEKRKRIVDRYRSHLEGITGIQLNTIQKNVKSNYAYFPVIFEANVFGASRDAIYAKLAEHEIVARKYFYPLTNSYDCYRKRFDCRLTPVAMHISKNVLTLPLYADLDLDDIDNICEIILKCMTKNDKPLRNGGKMKKILLLGGARSQIPAIVKAKELGYYTITCDYLPENPGHKYSDQYQNISTVDKEKVLEFSQKEKIDGIIAYASDPSAPSAAYVCDKMNLPGASYDATRILCRKDLFRQLQKDNGFYTPWYFSISNLEQLEEIRDKISFPCIVKPVDSSGSKGVKVIRHDDEIIDGVKTALHFSRCKRAIVEQYIDSPYDQLHGDGIVNGGKLEFLILGDQRFKNSVPIGTSIPSKIDEKVMTQAIGDTAKLIEICGFECGGINVEIRITDTNEVFVLEIGPRTGGNYVPQLMELSSGFDEVEASLKLAMGEPIHLSRKDKAVCCMQYIVGSERAGIFQELYIDEYMRKKVAQKYVHKMPGDIIEDYENSNGVVGVLLLKFDSMQEMETDIENMKQHVKVILRGE